MSANILVVEYEPRYVEHVRAALAAPDYRLEISSNMDEAVNRCANFEPSLVIITSVLPNLKIEDAITQLRARAGLRATPFLILLVLLVGVAVRARHHGIACDPRGWYGAWEHDMIQCERRRRLGDDGNPRVYRQGPGRGTPSRLT